MASITQVQTLMDAAVAALEAGNYSLAETKAAAALGVLSILPIEMRKEGFASGQIRYSETMINQFIDRCKNLAGRASRAKSVMGIQVAKVRLSPGTCTSDQDY